MSEKKDFLKDVVKHIDIKQHNVVSLVDAMEDMAFTARDLNRAANILDTMIKDGRIEGTALQFIRGRTYGQGKVLVVDESQNTTKAEMLAILTRLGKGGRIILVGDVSQKDIADPFDGLSYVVNMSKKVKEIQLIKLKENHRSDLVAKILEYEYR